MVRVSKQHSVQLASKAALIALILSSTALTPARLRAAELPGGATVTAGQASIAASGSNMLIDQASRNAIINWNSFSIGAGGTVNFNNGSGATLNRVTGTDVSGIHGSLNATGSLFLINQNGIVIGENGVVRTGGSFVASTLDIQDEDFLDGGDMTFSGDSAASVTNLGKVGSLGGDVAFIARHIVNEGELSAPDGTVGLAAGREVLMRDASLDDGRFLVKVGDANSSITEAGVISAASVELRANGGNIYALAGNSGGAINATGVSNSGGRIFLTAGGGKVRVAKKVRATRAVSTKRNGGDIFVNADVVNIAGLMQADGETGLGGNIDVGGGEIALNGALLDASGLEGGGRIRVGGAYQGGDFGAASTAQTTSVDEHTLLTANAIDSGNGGEVVVWADGTTLFDGTIEARGGAIGGDGGLIETSGADRLWVGSNAYVNALAPHGAVGDWLLDPKTVTIADGGTATLAQIADAGDTTSDLIIDASALNGAAANVSIVATETITFNEAVAMTNAGVGLSATAGNMITVSAGITTNNGAITFLADNYIINAEVNAGSATMMFDRVTAGLLDVGLTPGTSSGGAELDTAELARLTAGDLIFGDPVAAENQVSALSLRQFPSNPNISGLVQFNALDSDGSFLVTFGNQTYRSVEFNANDGVTFTANTTIATSVGDATFNVDADGTGVFGGFDNLEVNDGVTAVVNSAANILVKTPDIRERGAGTVSLNANGGAGTITFARSSAGSIVVGGGNGRFMSFSDNQLTRLTAGTINFGDPTTPNKTSAISVNAAGLSGIGTVNFNTVGTTSFSGVNSFTALATNGDTTTVNTNATINATGTLAFNTTTVNLDGNIGATGGITGTATTVNILGSTGGAEIQDGIGVAASGALPADNVTINVANGTYDSFMVTSDKTNLTVDGEGENTIIHTGSPAVTVNANGTTIQDMLLTYGGAGTPGIADVGILLNGDAGAGGTANLTGINIVNVDFSNLNTGMVSTGDIGDGNAATVDVTIRGNSSVDKAILEDFRHAAVAASDADGDAVYLIKDLIIQDGSDADALASSIFGIQLGTIGAATIQGVNMTHNVGADGIFIAPLTLTNANILIGGPDVKDANTIRGLSDGIDTGSLSGGTFIVQGNDLIYGANDAIDFNGNMINGTDVRIIDNAEISGDEDGIDVDGIVDSTLTISGNQLIMGGSSDGIGIEGTVSGTSTVAISDNTIGSSAVRVGADGIHFAADIAGTATVNLSGNLVYATGQAMEFAGIEAGAALSITSGTYDGTAGAFLLDNTAVAGAVGTLAISGSSFAGGSIFNGPVRLGGDTTIADTGAVTFNGTVDAAAAGGQSLAVNTAGTTTFNSAVGASAALFALNIYGGGETHLNAGSLTASGTSMTFDDAVVLISDTTISDAGNVSFNSTVDGGFGLTVNTTGVTRFSGKVGGSTALASLTTDSGGTTEVNGGLAATTGSQTYNDQVSVAGTVFAATGAGADLNFNAGVTTILPNNDVWFLAVDDIVFGGSAQWDGAGDMTFAAGWDGATGWVPGATTADTSAIITANAFGAAGGDVIIGNGTQASGIAVGSRNGTTTVLADNLSLTGGSSVLGFAQLGFQASNQGAAYDINGAIDVHTAGNITAQSGSSISTYAQIGHVGADVGADSTIEAAVNAPITIDAGGDVMFAGGSGHFAYAQLGHGGYGALGDHSGSIDIVSANDLTFTGGSGYGASAQLGHGGFGALGNHSGSIGIGSVNDLTFTGGSDYGASAQLGHGGVNASGNHSGSIGIVSANDLTFTGGSGWYASAQLGHGGANASGIHSGSIDIVSANDLTFTGGSGYGASAQLGHGGFGASGNRSGSIGIVSANDLTFTGGSGAFASAQLGHGGVSANGNHSGAIDVNTGTLALTGGTAANAYAQFGHGDVSGYSFGTQEGNISAIIDGLTTLTANTGNYWFGHATATVGGISKANVALVTGGLAVTGGNFATMIRNDLGGGNVLIANRLPQIADADPLNPDLTDDIVHFGVSPVVNVVTNNSLTYAATGEVTFEHGLQIQGAGNINLVSGWDGATGLDLSGFPALDMATVEAANAFGSSSGPNGDNGDVNIGDGTQGKPIRVGTHGGDVHVLAHDLEIRGGSSNASDAQLGAHVGGNAGASGNIRVAVIDDVIVQGGDGDDAFAILGHVHDDGTGDLSGDITILGDTAGNNNEIIVAGGDGLKAFGQIGHANFRGNASGNISITGEHIYAGDNRGSFADGPLAYTQIGHLSDISAASGDISINASGQVVAVGGDGQGTLAIIGHGGVHAFGAISVNAGSGVYVVGGDDEETWVQIGHYALSTASGNVGVSGETLEVLGGNGLGATAQIGHFSNSMASGNLTLNFTDTVEIAGGNDEGAAAFIGHDGYGDASGDISLDAGDILLRGGSDEDTEVQIGHANSVNPFVIGGTSNVTGNITINASGSVGLIGGTDVDAYAQIGHGLIGATITSINGAINVTAGDAVLLAGGDSLGNYAQIGHGGYFASASATVTGDISVDAMGNVEVLGGFGQHSSAQIGHGGYRFDGDVAGNISVSGQGAGGAFLPFPAVAVGSLGGDNSYAMVGHGGLEAQGAKSGDISVAMTAGGSLEIIGLAGGFGDNSSAQIGHGGVASSGAMSGNIDVSSTGDVVLRGGAGNNAFSLIGHGAASGDATGNITLIAEGEASLEDGTGAPAWIGHVTSSTVSGADVFLQAFGFDRSFADTVAAGDLGAFNKDILLADIPAGDFTLIATGTGLRLEDPVYNSPHRILVSVNNDLVLDPGAVFVNTGTGDIILAAGGDFHNDTGWLTPVVTGGRWLIYSTRPDNNRNDIEITNRDFLRYSTPFDINDPVPASFAGGNGLIYSVTPVVDLQASDETVYYGQTPAPTITQTVTVNGVAVNPAEFGLVFDVSSGGYTFGGNVRFASNGKPFIGYYQDGLIPNGLVTSYFGIVSNSTTDGDLTVIGTPEALGATDTRLARTRVGFGECSPSEDDLRKTAADSSTGQICAVLPVEED